MIYGQYPFIPSVCLPIESAQKYSWFFSLFASHSSYVCRLTAPILSGAARSDYFGWASTKLIKLVISDLLVNLSIFIEDYVLYNAQLQCTKSAIPTGECDDGVCSFLLAP